MEKFNGKIEADKIDTIVADFIENIDVEGNEQEWLNFALDFAEINQAISTYVCRDILKAETTKNNKMLKQLDRGANIELAIASEIFNK